MINRLISTLLCLVFVTILTLSNASGAETAIPLLPQQVISPYAGANQRLVLHSAKQFQSIFDEHNYSLKEALKSHTVPTIFTTNLPSDLNKQPVKEKIDDFIRLLLPNIIAVNQQILEVRKTLDPLRGKPLHTLTDARQRWLKELSARYNLDTVDVDLLLQHIDIIPTGMVLAQGIDESGWGTGHFAIKGNALYGEHLSEGGGKFMLTTDGMVKVAAYETLYEATAAYIYNLNSSHAYKSLRTIRYDLKKKNRLSGYSLVKALGQYSVRGQEYVNSLQSLIKNHHLDSYDSVTFESKKILVTIRFKHGTE